jgi:hypothetical protein
MRCVVHGVNPRERARPVRELAHALGVDDRPDRVGGPGKRHHAGSRRQLRLQVVVVEGRVVEQLDVPHDQVLVVRQLQPWCDAAVVIERGDEDLVARAEVASGGPRQGEVQRGHVRTEDHLVRGAPE